MSSEKTFLLYKFATTETAGSESYVEAPMGDDYTFDLDAIHRLMDDKTKIIFLTNPNNPTGTILPKKAIHDFIDSVPEDKIVVLDNAYHEYVSNPEDYAGRYRTGSQPKKRDRAAYLFQNLLPRRACVWVYSIANEALTAILNRTKAPFNVTRIAQAAALASLENDDFLIKSATLNRRNMDKLSGQAKRNGFQGNPFGNEFPCSSSRNTIPSN